MVRQLRTRKLVFTLNNPSEDGSDDPSLWLAEAFTSGVVRYAAWQYERGETGTLHIQGFVHFKDKHSRNMAQRYHTMFWDHQQGSNDDCFAYVRKDSGLSESEEMPGGHARQGELGGPMPQDGAGTRNDLLDCKSLIDDGKPMLDVAEAHFKTWCRNHRAFDKYRQLRAKPRTWRVHTRVFFGPPGCGKSHLALQEAGADAYWLSKANSERVFWDGYDGQKHVVIDEFSGWMTKEFMCRLLDCYPMNVETKGSAVPVAIEKVWITSNHRPEAWFPKKGLGAIARRLRPPCGACFKMSPPPERSLQQLKPGTAPREREELAEDTLEPEWLNVSEGEEL